MICEECLQEFELPKTRGRPPKRCVTCRENHPKPTVSVGSLDRVANLEMLLKSRGTHISQNRSEYE